MLPKDKESNIKRSVAKLLFETLSSDYFINYGQIKGEDLQKRIEERVEGYWKWIDLHWVKVGEGIFSVSLLQINCNSIIEMDPYGLAVDEMGDDIQEELNVDTIPLLDFSGDPENPIPTDNILIPRFRGTKAMRNELGDTVSLKALNYNIYVFRESILP